jgi:hypothetical protein
VISELDACSCILGLNALLALPLKRNAGETKQAVPDGNVSKARSDELIRDCNRLERATQPLTKDRSLESHSRSTSEARQLLTSLELNQSRKPH